MKKSRRGGSGRGNIHQKTEKTTAEVIALKSFGNTQEEIATYLGINIDTLYKYYRYELDTAQVRTNAEVARKLYTKATKKDDLSAQIFWLKTRARWRTTDIENIIDQNEGMKEEIKVLRAKLDEKNKKDY